ncbi:MAG: hypothetical protein ACP5KO_00165 [Caldimicrobium sp.]|jgi:cell division protein FtsL|uniref:Cell division protein FtsL n=1 Tax=Caldimicrobium thiodismutans TaxID=1653476 RepID=A0A2N7PLI6_9BACT|nr:MAG: hypothetical protein C0197_00150 [Caldimicrobium thiodismutans]
MAGKVHTLKPDVNYQRISPRKKAEEEVSLKERIREAFESLLLIILFSILIVATAGVAYKSFIYFKVKREKNHRLAEKMVLEEQLNKLTSREILLDKARKLGLRPPKEEDYIYLK